MARRTYKRDSNGRFASSGSTGRQRPASRPAPRGRNRLTRDNSGRITGTGDGATARGGRLRTGAGNLRATQTARLKRGGSKAQKPKPSRIANRSTADQAHRDKLAKQFKKLDKATRRAYASARYGKQAISELRSFGSKTQKAIQSTAHQHRKYIRDTVTGQLMPNRQAHGRKALTKQERAELAASVQQSAQGLRARQSVTRYGRRMGGNGATQTARLKGRGAGTVTRPKGLKPQPGATLRKELAFSRMREMNRRVADKPDMAQVNIPGRFTGQSGKRFAASIAKAASQTAALQRAQMLKPKDQVRAEAAARKATKEAAAAAKPKRTRTAESMRTSRAKRILKEREMKISGTYRQWENSKRVQDRALAIYADRARASKKRKP